MCMYMHMSMSVSMSMDMHMLLLYSSTSPGGALVTRKRGEREAGAHINAVSVTEAR